MINLRFDGNYNLKIDSSNVDQNYAALCVITKNDNINDINEFLAYHFKIGIGRIYLYDTGSNKTQLQIFEFFSDFFEKGQLFYSYWNYGPSKIGFNLQIDIYNKCAENFAKNHVWLGFIDTDEFIVLRNIDDNKNNNNINNNNKNLHQNNLNSQEKQSKLLNFLKFFTVQKNQGRNDNIQVQQRQFIDQMSYNYGDPYNNSNNHFRLINNNNSEIQHQQQYENKENQIKNIQDFLKQYEEYGALTMNWVMFGSSGFQTHQKSALKSYTKCVLHDHVKTFVNVRYWNKRITNVHFIDHKNFLNNRFAVDENFEPQKGPVNRRFPGEKIVVFHYVLKSLEDYEVKMKRGDASGHQVRQPIFFDFINNNTNNYICTEGVQLHQQLLQSKL